MCVDPMTALSVGGGLLGAAGSLFGGNANAKAAEQAAQVAQLNAKTTLNYAEGSADQIQQRVDRTIGAARANYGGANLNVSVGSPLAVQAMSATQGNTDKQLTIARGLNQASGQNFAAGQDYQKAGQDQIAGILGAGTALLHGLGGIRGLGGASGLDGVNFGAPFGFHFPEFS